MNKKNKKYRVEYLFDDMWLTKKQLNEHLKELYTDYKTNKKTEVKMTKEHIKIIKTADIRIFVNSD